MDKVSAEDSSLKVEFSGHAYAEAKYVITATPSGGGEPVNSEQSYVGEVTISGLINDLEYTVTVVATNEAGQRSSTAPSPVAPTKIKKLFSDLKSTKSGIETEIKTLQEKLDKKLGMWGALEGKCIEQSSGHFTYKFCGFDEVNQKDGGAWTGLGRYKGWEDGIEGGKMKYENGQRCWNGPERSTIVTLVCEDEDKILEVAEPETCKYTMTVGTPLKCTEADMPQLFGAVGKDEL
eukprot:SAG11_NODE_2046_length_3884_cov_2.228005_4_plen_235_part_00